MSVMILILNSLLIHSPDQGSLFCHRRCFNETCEYETSPLSQCESSGCIRPHRLLLNNVSGVSTAQQQGRVDVWRPQGGCKQGKAGVAQLMVSSACLAEASKGGGVNTNNTLMLQIHLHCSIFHWQQHWQKSHRSRSRTVIVQTVGGGVTGRAPPSSR